jgi:hypothetical protein
MQPNLIRFTSRDLLSLSVHRKRYSRPAHDQFKLNSFVKDSMIYHWRPHSSWSKCYLTAWVSSSEDFIAAQKSGYSSDGDNSSRSLESQHSSGPKIVEKHELEHASRAGIPSGYTQLYETVTWTHKRSMSPLLVSTVLGTPKSAWRWYARRVVWN